MATQTQDYSDEQLTFVDENTGQQAYHKRYNLADLSVTTQKEVKSLIYNLRTQNANAVEHAFDYIKNEISHRLVHVMFEPLLDCDPLTDHKVPKSLLPLYIDYINKALEELHGSQHELIQDQIIQAFGRSYAEEIDVKYKLQQRIDELEIELYHFQSQSAVQAQIIQQLQASISGEKQKFIREMQMMKEQVQQRKIKGNNYEPDFNEIPQIQDVLQLPQINLDTIRSRSTKDFKSETSKLHAELRILKQQIQQQMSQLKQIPILDMQNKKLQQELENEKLSNIKNADALNQKLQKATDDLAEFKQLSERLQAQIEEYLSDIQHKDGMIQAQKERINEMQEQNKEYNAVKSEFTKLSIKMEKANKAIEKLTNELGEAKEQLEALKSEHAQAVEENEHYSAQMKELEETLEIIKAENEDLQDQIQKAEGASLANSSRVSTGSKSARKKSTKSQEVQVPDNHMSSMGSLQILFPPKRITSRPVSTTRPVKQELEPNVIKQQILATGKDLGFVWKLEEVDATMRKLYDQSELLRTARKTVVARTDAQEEHLRNIWQQLVISGAVKHQKNIYEQAVENIRQKRAMKKSIQIPRPEKVVPYVQGAIERSGLEDEVLGSQRSADEQQVQQDSSGPQGVKISDYLLADQPFRQPAIQQNIDDVHEEVRSRDHGSDQASHQLQQQQFPRAQEPAEGYIHQHAQEQQNSQQESVKQQAPQKQPMEISQRKDETQQATLQSGGVSQQDAAYPYKHISSEKGPDGVGQQQTDQRDMQGSLLAAQQKERQQLQQLVQQQEEQIIAQDHAPARLVGAIVSDENQQVDKNVQLGEFRHQQPMEKQKVAGTTTPQEHPQQGEAAIRCPSASEHETNDGLPAQLTTAQGNVKEGQPVQVWPRVEDIGKAPAVVIRSQQQPQRDGLQDGRPGVELEDIFAAYKTPDKRSQSTDVARTLTDTRGRSAGGHRSASEGRQPVSDIYIQDDSLTLDEDDIVNDRNRTIMVEIHPEQIIQGHQDNEVNNDLGQQVRTVASHLSFQQVEHDEEEDERILSQIYAQNGALSDDQTPEHVSGRKTPQDNVQVLKDTRYNSMLKLINKIQKIPLNRQQQEELDRQLQQEINQKITERKEQIRKVKKAEQAQRGNEIHVTDVPEADDEYYDQQIAQHELINNTLKNQLLDQLMLNDEDDLLIEQLMLSKHGTTTLNNVFTNPKQPNGEDAEATENSRKGASEAVQHPLQYTMKGQQRQGANVIGTKLLEELQNKPNLMEQYERLQQKEQELLSVIFNEQFQQNIIEAQQLQSDDATVVISEKHAKTIGEFIYNPLVLRHVVNLVPGLRDDYQHKISELYQPSIQKNIFNLKINRGTAQILAQTFYDEHMLNVLASSPVSLTTHSEKPQVISNIKKIQEASHQTSHHNPFDAVLFGQNIQKCIISNKNNKSQTQLQGKLTSFYQSRLYDEMINNNQLDKQQAAKLNQLIKDPQLMQMLVQSDQINKKLSKKLFKLYSKDVIDQIEANRIQPEIQTLIADVLIDPFVVKQVFSDKINVQQNQLIARRRNQLNTVKQINYVKHILLNAETARLMASGQLAKPVASAIYKIFYNKNFAERVAQGRFSTAIATKISNILYNPEFANLLKRPDVMDRDVIRMFAQTIYNEEMAKILLGSIKADQDDYNNAKQCCDIVKRMPQQTAADQQQVQPFRVQIIGRRQLLTSSKRQNHFIAHQDNYNSFVAKIPSQTSDRIDVETAKQMVADSIRATQTFSGYIEKPAPSIIKTFEIPDRTYDQLLKECARKSMNSTRRLEEVRSQQIARRKRINEMRHQQQSARKQDTACHVVRLVDNREKQEREQSWKQSRKTTRSTNRDGADKSDE